MSKSWIHSAQVTGLVCCLAGCGGGGDGAPEAGTPASGGGPVAAASWQVGGTAQGVNGAGLVLLNNGGEQLTVPASGSFAFATALASGATFSISIAAQPSGQLCSVTNGSGSVVDANVTAVGVSCVTAAAGAGAEHGSGPDPIATISTNPGSGDLIRAALDAGTLTPEQALLYAMYAEYEDPRVPAQYLGDDAGLIEGTAHEKVLDYIATVGLANVSQATLDALKPFFIPAHQEGSYQRASLGAHDKTAARATAPQGAKAGWTAVAGTNVVVWYETSRAASDAANAAMLVAEFDNRIWPMLTGLMGRTPKSDLGSKFFTETDGRLDVTLADLPKDKEGVTTPVDWVAENTAVHIALSRDLSPQGLQAQAAHEFMHAIQFSIDVKAYSMPYYATIKEATASWASHYVYPLNGWESKYAQYYLKGGQFGYAYDSPRNKTEAGNIAFRYGAYVLPLFLQKRFGPGIVKDIWDRTVTEAFELMRSARRSPPTARPSKTSGRSSSPSAGTRRRSTTRHGSTRRRRFLSPPPPTTQRWTSRPTTSSRSPTALPGSSTTSTCRARRWCSTGSGSPAPARAASPSSTASTSASTPSTTAASATRCASPACSRASAKA